MDESDALTLDQLRVFLVVVEEGSFSAAARRLRRVQSAVSYAIGNLERLLDLSLFDRSAKTPTLTAAGRALVGDARAVQARVARLRARAGQLCDGEAPELRLAIDAMCLAEAIDAGRAAVEAVETPSRVRCETMTSPTAVVDAVLTGEAAAGVTRSRESWPAALSAEPLGEVAMCAVTAPGHPLATSSEPLEDAAFRRHPEVVLAAGDPSELAGAARAGATWRVADLVTMIALIESGACFGVIPRVAAGDALARGTLVALRPRGWPSGGRTVTLYAVRRATEPRDPIADRFVAALAEVLSS